MDYDTAENREISAPSAMLVASRIALCEQPAAPRRDGRQMIMRRVVGWPSLDRSPTDLEPRRLIHHTMSANFHPLRDTTARAHGSVSGRLPTVRIAASGTLPADRRVSEEHCRSRNRAYLEIPVKSAPGLRSRRSATSDLPPRRRVHRLAVVALNVGQARAGPVRYCLLAEQSRRIGSRPVKASVAAGCGGCSLDRPRPPPRHTR